MVDDHCMQCPEEADLRIPLELYGVTSYFPSQKPSINEVGLFEQDGGIHLTLNHPEWDPKSDFFAELENMMIDADGNVRGTEKSRVDFLRGRPSILAVQTVDNLVGPFRSLRIPDEIHASAVMTHMQRKHYADQLVEAWSISPTMARRTIRVTTQQGIQTWGTVNTKHCYPSGDRPLHYNRIPHKMYHNTFFSTTKSSKGNTCSHIFATDFAWSRNYTLVSKGDPHLAMDDRNPAKKNLV